MLFLIIQNNICLLTNWYQSDKFFLRQSSDKKYNVHFFNVYLNF